MCVCVLAQSSESGAEEGCAGRADRLRLPEGVCETSGSPLRWRSGAVFTRVCVCVCVCAG